MRLKAISMILLHSFNVRTDVNESVYVSILNQNSGCYTVIETIRYSHPFQNCFFIVPTFKYSISSTFTFSIASIDDAVRYNPGDELDIM